MCHQNVTEPQATEYHTNSTHCALQKPRSDFHSFNSLLIMGVMFTLDRSLHSGENHFFLYNRGIGMHKQYYREVQ